MRSIAYNSFTHAVNSSTRRLRRPEKKEQKIKFSVDVNHKSKDNIIVKLFIVKGTPPKINTIWQLYTGVSGTLHQPDFNVLELNH